MTHYNTSWIYADIHIDLSLDDYVQKISPDTIGTAGHKGTV